MNGASLLAPIAKRLAGKVALITGGASGIGESSARLFAKHGAKVIIADIQDELGFSVSQDKSTNGAISYVHCDVTSESDVQNAVNTTVSKHGKLDIMFNNAGIASTTTEANILTVEHKDYQKVFDVNVLGSILGAKHAAKVMIPAKRGTILFTTSAVTESHIMASHTYTASKHAVLGLTKNLCVELGRYGIRVNCISPFAVVTPIFIKSTGIDNKKAEEAISSAANLKGPILKAEDLAEAALFLASEESKYVSGLNLVVDGGYSATNIALTHSFQKFFT